jgi:hypothetical protein
MWWYLYACFVCVLCVGCLAAAILIRQSGSPGLFAIWNGQNSRSGITNPVYTAMWSYFPAYRHSITKSVALRGGSDCTPDCPTFRVWKWRMGTEEREDGSIAVARAVGSPLRIISVSLFGANPKYLQGLRECLACETPGWSFRVYAARGIGPPKEGEVAEEFLEEIHRIYPDRVEIAYTDTNLARFDKSATFWRFAIMDEPLPPRQSLQYAIRDVDWHPIPHELELLRLWGNSGYLYCRITSTILMGPMNASKFAGKILADVRTGAIPGIQEMMAQYPYHSQYGDDEIFLRDRVWPFLKNSDSVITFGTRAKAGGKGMLDPVVDAGDLKDISRYYTSKTNVPPELLRDGKPSVFIRIRNNRGSLPHYMNQGVTTGRPNLQWVRDNCFPKPE